MTAEQWPLILDDVGSAKDCEQGLGFQESD